jgi:type II secretory pathway pseudopilin PulG
MVRPPRNDDGVSLTELIVAMGIMAMVGAIFAGGILQIYRSVNKADSTYEAQSQINLAFVRLDKEVRYARAISDPGTVSGDYYVDYLVQLNSVDTCVELRLRTSTSELQRRTWTKNATPLAPTSWTTLATGVTSSAPFTTVAADKNSLTGFRFQRLTLDVTSAVGSGNSGSSRQTTVTFTALNATATDNAQTCTEARGVSS